MATYTRPIGGGVEGQARLWSILQDIPGWPRWDLDLESIRVTAPGSNPASPLLGTTGSLTMKEGAGTFSFCVDAMRPGYLSYTTPLPGAVATWSFAWGEARDVRPDGTWDMTMGVSFQGWASFAYRWLINKKAITAFGVCVGELKKLVEAGESR